MLRELAAFSFFGGCTIRLRGSVFLLFVILSGLALVSRFAGFGVLGNVPIDVTLLDRVGACPVRPEMMNTGVVLNVFILHRWWPG